LYYLYNTQTHLKNQVFYDTILQKISKYCPYSFVRKSYRSKFLQEEIKKARMKESRINKEQIIGGN